MNVEEAVKGLRAASAYLEKTRGLLQAENYLVVAGQQARQWQQRVSQMCLSDVNSASLLLEEVSAGSWPDELKQQLLASVAKRSGESAVAPAPPARGRQSMKNFDAYMTQADLDQLRQTTSGMSKLDVLCSRMFRIVLHAPSEQASGSHTGMIFSFFCTPTSHCLTHDQTTFFDGEPALPRVGQSCGVDVQNAKHGNDMLKDLRKGLKSKTRRHEHPDAPHILEYPALPSALKDILGPEAFQVWWRSAYGDNDQPLEEKFTTERLPEQVALRKSSRLLRPADAPPAREPSSSSSSNNPAMQCVQALG